MVSLTSTKNQMLRPHKVARWVRHGLNFPQYAERFMSHGITLLDFPALLADDGAALREELGVESALHRAKLTRALKRQLLQLGRLPGEPTDVRAAVVAEDVVVVKWRPPRQHGHPPVHAYAVQVREPGSHEWRVCGAATHEDEDDEVHSAKAFVTPTREMAAAAHAAGVGNGRNVPLRFRVVAWGGHGGGVSDESASVEMKPLRRSYKREGVRAGGGQVESDSITAGNTVVTGSNPRVRTATAPNRSTCSEVCTAPSELSSSPRVSPPGSRSTAHPLSRRGGSVFAEAPKVAPRERRRGFRSTRAPAAHG